MPKIAIVVGEFHQREAKIMVEEASQTIREGGHEVGDVVWVPGSYEVPLALKRQLLAPDVAGAVVLGIIEKGETAHGLVMAQSVSAKIIDLQLEFMKPVGLGILGPEIFPSQIEPRIRPYARAAAAATLRLLAV